MRGYSEPEMRILNLLMNPKINITYDKYLDGNNNKNSRPTWTLQKNSVQLSKEQDWILERELQHEHKKQYNTKKRPHGISLNKNLLRQLGRIKSKNRQLVVMNHHEAVIERAELQYYVTARPNTKKQPIPVWRIKKGLATWRQLAINYGKSGHLGTFFRTQFNIEHEHRFELTSEFKAVMNGFTQENEIKLLGGNVEKMAREQGYIQNLHPSELFCLDRPLLFIRYLEDPQCCVKDLRAIAKRVQYPKRIVGRAISFAEAHRVLLGDEDSYAATNKDREIAWVRAFLDLAAAFHEKHLAEALEGQGEMLGVRTWLQNKFPEIWEEYRQEANEYNIKNMQQNTKKLMEGRLKRSKYRRGI